MHAFTSRARVVVVRWRQSDCVEMMSELIVDVALVKVERERVCLYKRQSKSIVKAAAAAGEEDEAINE